MREVGSSFIFIYPNSLRRSDARYRRNDE